MGTAAVFFILEVTTLSFVFLWFGLAGALLGLVVLVAPAMAWELQIVLWAVLSVGGALGWRVYKRHNPDHIKSDEPRLNRRGEQYIDRVFTLETPIENGFGKVKVDDSIWKIESDTDLPAGRKIRVTAVQGTILQVKEEL
ncbi:MAG: NfeD family protein [Bdellovibrionales bacterium]